MKKLAVLMMIAALATFMVPVIASADDEGWESFHGTYQMSASGSCLHSSLEYFPNAQRNNNWTAPADSKVYAGVTVANGTWTFESTGAGTGKGAYSQRIYATILPGGTDSMPGPNNTTLPVPVEVRVLPPLSVVPSAVSFTYDIDPSSENITVTEDASGIKHYGSISIDKKSMTLLNANNVQPFGGLFGYTICNFTRTLIKVGN